MTKIVTDPGSIVVRVPQGTLSHQVLPVNNINKFKHLSFSVDKL